MIYNSGNPPNAPPDEKIPDFLKEAFASGILDLSGIEEAMNKKKREEILSRHPYSVWKGKDDFWRTYLPDPGKKNGRRIVKRKTEESIVDAILKHYSEEPEKVWTFKDAYFQWRSKWDKTVSDNSVYKYDTDYNRFFEDSDYINLPIKDITEEDIIVFMSQTVREKELIKTACKRMYWYLTRTFQSAKVNGIIQTKPTDDIKAAYFYKYCKKESVSKKKTISNADLDTLKNKFEIDLKKKPEYIPLYAVLFALLTGMRVSEIVAIRWDAIRSDEEGSYIIIDKSEKHNRKTNEFTIEATKNGEERIFPVTDKISSLLKQIHDVEEKAGFLSEWVFSNDKGRIHGPVVSSCIKNKCLQVGLPTYGIHGIRKTFNSKMRTNGTPVPIAAALLGHTCAVNEAYYTFDVVSLHAKRDVVDFAEL